MIGRVPREETKHSRQHRIQDSEETWRGQM